MKRPAARLPIRILHVLDNMQGIGGMEKNVVELTRQMDPDRFEHSVCVIRSLGVLTKDLHHDRVKVTCLERTHTGRSFLVGALIRQIKHVKPHIVHSRNWSTIEAVLAGRCTGSCALVHSEHGLDAGISQREPLRRRLFRRAAYQMADRVFSVSCALRDLHSRNTGFPSEKISVIYNGVDTERFRPQESVRIRVRQELGIAPTDFCVGAIGRLEPVKDLFTLLRAASEIPDFCKNWRLLIVGEGIESSSLRQFVSNQPELQGRTRFFGEIRSVPDLLNALDVYVLPSLYEGISNSLLEAMATGLPVIASAVGGNGEVVSDRESGFLFPVGEFRTLANRLQVLRDHKETRLELQRCARERVNKCFSLTGMVRAYEDLYANV